MLDNALERNHTDAQQIIEQILMEEPNRLSWNLNELLHIEIPFRHPFKLRGTTPVCFCSQRKPVKLISVLRKEAKTMLAGRFINPATSSWAFHVMIAKKWRYDIWRGLSCAEYEYESRPMSVGEPWRIVWWYDCSKMLNQAGFICWLLWS